MELLFVANTLGRICCSCFRCSPREKRRYTSESESEVNGLDLQDQGRQDQTFQGQGFHLQENEHSGQGSHFQQAKMKMEPRYQMSDAQRAQVGLALNHPNNNIPQQAAPAPPPSSVPAKNGSNKFSQAGEVATTSECHQSGQITAVDARESDAALE